MKKQEGERRKTTFLNGTIWSCLFQASEIRLPPPASCYVINIARFARNKSVASGSDCSSYTFIFNLHGHRTSSGEYPILVSTYSRACQPYPPSYGDLGLANIRLLDIARPDQHRHLPHQIRLAVSRSRTVVWDLHATCDAAEA